MVIKSGLKNLKFYANIIDRIVEQEEIALNNKNPL